VRRAMLIDEMWCKFVRRVVLPMYRQELFITEPVAQCHDLTKCHLTHGDTALNSFRRVLQISRGWRLGRFEHSGRNGQTRCQRSSFQSPFNRNKSIGARFDAQRVFADSSSRLGIHCDLVVVIGAPQVHGGIRPIQLQLSFKSRGENRLSKSFDWKAFP
jgi:hypothetical protein